MLDLELDSYGTFLNVCLLWIACLYLFNESYFLYERTSRLRQQVKDHDDDIIFISELMNHYNGFNDIGELRAEIARLRNLVEQPSVASEPVIVTSEDAGQLDVETMDSEVELESDTVDQVPIYELQLQEESPPLKPKRKPRKKAEKME